MAKTIKTSKLKELVTIQAGYQFRGRVENDPDGDGYLVQLKDITDGGQFHSSSDLTCINTEEIGDQYKLRDGDLLIPNRGRYSFAAIVVEPEETTVAAGHFYILRTDPDQLIPGFLCWFINTRKGQHHLEKYKRGTSIPVLSKVGIEDMEIPLPSMHVQKSIAEVNVLAKEEHDLMERLIELRAAQLEGNLLHGMDF